MGENLSAGRVSLDGVLLMNKSIEYVLKMRSTVLLLDTRRKLQYRHATVLKTAV